MLIHVLIGSQTYPSFTGQIRLSLYISVFYGKHMSTSYDKYSAFQGKHICLLWQNILLLTEHIGLTTYRLMATIVALRGTYPFLTTPKSPSWHIFTSYDSHICLSRHIFAFNGINPPLIVHIQLS